MLERPDGDCVLHRRAHTSFNLTPPVFVLGSLHVRVLVRDGVHHDMELLVVLVCPSDGVAGQHHVLRTYLLAHMLLHVEELRVVHVKCTGNNFVGYTPPFECHHQALVLLHAASKLL